MDRPVTCVPVGRTVVPAPQVRDGGDKLRVVIPHHDHPSEPLIELVREGDVVRAIDVTCPCGQRYRLLCDYEAAPGK